MTVLRRTRAYAGAVAAVVLATAARWLLDRVLGDHSAFVTYYVAVVVVAWLATRWPAVLTLVLGAAAASFFFVPPRHVLVPHLTTAEHQGAFGVYAVTGIVVIAIFEARRATQRQADLRREELQVTLSSIGDAVITTDNAGRVTSLNPVAVALTGWSPDEARGRPLLEVFHIVNEETREVSEDPVRRILAQRKAVGLSNHTLLISKDATERPIEDSGAPILGVDGEVLGVVLIFRDIGERRAADRASARLAAIVESSDDAIVSKSLDGIVTSWNRGAEKVFGYTAAEAVGQHISFIIPAELRAQEDLILAKLRRGETLDHFETVRLTKDGRYIDVSLTVSPMRDREGRIIGASKIARDITEHRRAADELRQTAAELSDANRRQREFLALLSHELRNPLAAMRNALEILRGTSGDEQTPKQVLDMMERQFGHLVRLVDDLLDISRISRSGVALRRETVELSAALRTAIDAARQHCDSRDQELTVVLPPAPLYLDADAARLAQIVGNLLNNASKFTGRGGSVRLAVERQGSQVLIRVQDTGIGIAADQLERIFEMFVQVDASIEQSQGGLGLGLTLVKNLVELHGGTVEARSPGLGKGSEFVVRLPVLDIASRGPSPAERSEIGPAASAKRRILVVDDNRDAAASLALVLERNGHDVHTVYDGLDAVTAAAKLRPDVVLLDIGMPRLNGYEAARRIRQADKSAVLVAITGWGHDEDRQRSKEAGIDAHLTKPVGYADLMTLVTAAQARSERG